MATLWHDLDDRDALEYPYEPLDFQLNFHDPFKRNIHRLLASLACFGHRIQAGEATLEGELDDRLIETITRLCEDANVSEDLNVLLRNYPPDDLQSHCIVDCRLLASGSPQSSAALGDINVYEQMIFYENLGVNQWVIYLALMSRRCIEVYVIGESEMPDIDTGCAQILRFLTSVVTGIPFRCRHRLQLPPAFCPNTVFLVYVLLKLIHHHGKYLDLDLDSIARHKLSILKDFNLRHDQWLGKVFVDPQSHPFVTTEYEDDPDEIIMRTEIETFGWTAIDVDGDGNCGYYSLVLGFENLGYFNYSVKKKGSCGNPMPRNKPWQFNIMRLRKDLQDHSRDLLKTTYPRGTRTDGWWILTTEVEDDAIESLTKLYYEKRISQQVYFDGSLLKVSKQKYQMTPYWSAHVVATKFQLRVIVYTRTASWVEGEEKLTFEWATTTTAPHFPMNARIQVIPNMNRISDLDYKRTRTIEILYTTGWKGFLKAEHNHFQYLRRVFCDNVEQPPDPSPAKLGNYLLPNRVPLEQVLARVEHRGKNVTKMVHNAKKYSKRTTKKEITRQKTLYTRFFNAELQKNTLTHKTATQMFYNPFTKRFFIRNIDDSGKLQPKKYVENTHEYDIRLVNAAKELPEVWVGNSPGDPGNSVAPSHLATKVVTLYQQHGNPYCLAYSMASALFYCGFQVQAEGLYGKAKQISTMHFEEALQEVMTFMRDLVPVLGLPTLYGRRTKSHSRTKRELTWEDLFLNVTPYPTIVIPIAPHQGTNHAFCVVDDLIFDSITPFALKLQRESVQWIFNDANCQMYQVYRFNMKCSPPGQRLKEKYTRQVTFHWDHPSRLH